MSVLNSLFDVVRGHVTGQDNATIQENFKPASGYTPNEGDIVSITVDSGEPRIEAASAVQLDGAADVAALGSLLADLPHLWLVVSGMNATTDFDGVFTGKAVCILGTYMVKTENYNGADTFVVGGPVTVAAGVVRANPLGGQDYQKYGEVIENNHATNGTLIIAVQSSGI